MQKHTLAAEAENKRFNKEPPPGSSADNPVIITKDDEDLSPSAKAVATEHVAQESNPNRTRRPRTRALASLQNMNSSDRTVQPPAVEENEDGVTFIGSNRDRALCIIAPPHEDDNKNNSVQEDLAIIREVNSIFGAKSMAKEMRHAEANGDKSVRPIQSKRFEVFVRNAGDKGSKFWDSALKRRRQEAVESTCLTATSTSRLVQYAQAQARRDPRIRNAPHDYKFSNFSLIVSYGSVPAQAPHLDLVGPNFQFILILTNGSPSTNIYDLEEGDRVQSVTDLRRVWKKEKLEQRDRATFPSNLAKMLEASPDVVDFLSDFGDVLHSNDFLKSVEKRQDGLSAGTLLSLPGGVVHAGPACSSYRVVLFFSAVPVTKTGPPLSMEYNPDTQFGNVLLTGFLVQLVWRAVGITAKDRLYLLRRLATYIRQAEIRTGWERHFHDCQSLRKVVLRMTRKADYHELDDYLVKMAAQDDLVFYHVELSGIKGDFQCVSDSRLHTRWDGGLWQVVVYRRAADGKVLLRNPNKQVKKEGDGWKGHESGQHYRLEMQRRTTSDLFDGANGKLLDGEGNEIKCFLVQRQNKKRKRR